MRALSGDVKTRGQRMTARMLRIAQIGGRNGTPDVLNLMWKRRQLQQRPVQVVRRGCQRIRLPVQMLPQGAGDLQLSVKADVGSATSIGKAGRARKEETATIAIHASLPKG